MFNIRIISINLRTENSRGFRRHVAEGLPCYSMIQALTPGYVTVEGGLKRIEPYECVLHAPRMPRTLAAIDSESVFTTNWFHFEAEDISEAMDSYGIEFNKIYSPESATSVSDCIRTMFTEHIRPQPDDGRLMALAFQQLMLLMSRPHPRTSQPDSPYSHHYEMLAQLRFEIYNDCALDWSVEQLALRLGVSSTWLNVLYHGQFGLSPKQDIINARVERAKSLLAFTNMSLREIALSTGFSNEYYFSRLFRKAAGVAPGEYRRERMMFVSGERQ